MESMNESRLVKKEWSGRNLFSKLFLWKVYRNFILIIIRNNALKEKKLQNILLLLTPEKSKNRLVEIKQNEKDLCVKMALMILILAMMVKYI